MKSSRLVRFALSVLPFVSMLLTLVSAFALAQNPPSRVIVPDSPSEIIQRMVRQNAIRAERLRYFTSKRHYHVEFHGIGRTMSADMRAQVTHTAGAGKTFQVIDQSGSELLLNHVLKRLLQTEQDDSHQQTAALTPVNYSFTLQSSGTLNGRPVYIFAVSPISKRKLLYRGRIWIDAADYAVAQVEAEPAVNPSFWIKSTKIHHTYVKIGDFWLPQMDKSESRVRFGGTAVLTIDYGTYQFDPSHQYSSGDPLSGRAMR